MRRFCNETDGLRAVKTCLLHNFENLGDILEFSSFVARNFYIRHRLFLRGLGNPLPHFRPSYRNTIPSDSSGVKNAHNSRFFGTALLRQSRATHDEHKKYGAVQFHDIACSRSAIISAGSSMPMDSRTTSGPAPALTRSSSDNWRCVVEAG